MQIRQMKQYGTLAVAVLLVWTSFALAEVPTLDTATLKLFDMITPNTTGTVAVFTLKFRQQVKISGFADRDVSLSDDSDADLVRGLDITYDPTNPSVITKAVPKLLNAAKVAHLHCNTVGNTILTFPAMTETQLLTGTPTGMLMLHPTDEPAASMPALFGGRTFSFLDWHGDQLSFGLILNGTRNGAAFTNQDLDIHTLSRAGACYLDVGLDEQNTNLIVSASTAEPYPTGSIWFNMTDHLCTPLGAKYFNQSIAEMDEHALNVSSEQQMRSWEISSAVYTLFDAWPGCRMLAALSFTSASEPTVFNNVHGCAWKEDTPEFDNSPCCNKALAFSTHCEFGYTANVTSDIIRTVRVPTTVPASKVSAYKSSIYAYVNLIREQRLSIGNEQLAHHVHALEYPRYRAETRSIIDGFMRAIFAAQNAEKRSFTDCKAHTDCLHGYVCDFSVGVCKFPHTDPIRFIGSHLGHHLSDEAMIVMQRLRSMDPTSTTMLAEMRRQLSTPLESELTIDLLPGIVASPMHYRPAQLNLTAADCAGPHSARCRSNYTEEMDELGNWKVTEVEANKTCCETTGQHCNYNARLYADQTSCTGAAQISIVGSNFCGVRDGGSLTDYREIGNQPNCISTRHNTSTTCAAAGYTWYTEPNGYAACMTGSTTLGGCLGTGATGPCASLYTAVGAAIAGNTYRHDDPTLNSNVLCASTVCWSTVVSAATCWALPALASSKFSANNPLFKVALGIAWHPGPGICVAALHHVPLTQQGAVNCRDLESNYTLARGIFQYHAGTAFRPGMWDTQDKCQSSGAGHCSVPRLNHFGTTATQCRGARSCAHSCSKCVSIRKDATGQSEKGMCYDARALTEAMCQAPGVWRNYTTVAPTGATSTQNHGICEYPIEDSATCTALAITPPTNVVPPLLPVSMTWASCHSFTTKATCDIAGASDRTYAQSWIYKALQCAWDWRAPCTAADNSDCDNERRCDDDELDTCTCTPGTLCSCANGACIQPWAVDATSNARNECPLGDAGIVQTRIGCKDEATLTSTACALKGGTWTWYAKAFTEADCLAHGYGCYALSSKDQVPGVDVLLRNNTECRAGGSGNITSHYRWLLGSTEHPNDLQNDVTQAQSRLRRSPQGLRQETFDSSKWQSSQWLPRLWTNSGDHTTTISFSRAQQMAYQIAMRTVYATKLRRVLGMRFHQMKPIIHVMADSMATDTDRQACGDNCEDPVFVYHPNCLIPPGSKAVCQTEQGALLIPPVCHPDADCVAGTIKGHPTLNKLCLRCLRETTPVQACTCTKAVSDTALVPTETCGNIGTSTTLGCRVGHTLSVAQRCGCIRDDGTAPNAMDVAYPMPDPATATSRITTHAAVSLTTLSFSSLVRLANSPTCPAVFQGLSFCGGRWTESSTQSLFSWAGVQTLLINTWNLLGFSGSVVFTTDGTIGDVVKNDNGDTIGRLLGGCTALQTSSSETTNLFPASFDVPINSVYQLTLLQINDQTYPVYDLCAANYGFGPPLELDVTVNSTHVSAVITGPGYYCPCQRLANWRSTTKQSDRGLFWGGIIAAAVIGAGLIAFGIFQIVQKCPARAGGYTVVGSVK